ncbi:uncharacterized protein LOC142497941 isoform X3 [Ascaphus truei]|uniref:uncharacterized protein LOC142497941 isoform X1 n=1 Tax=Ascaphus truei TaxID=8439 RepID=UPI003F590B1C
MTSFICTLSIFLALMSTVYCVRCKQCWNLNSTECCGNTFVDCTGACITYSEKCAVGRKSLLSIRSGCEYDLPLQLVVCNKFLSIKTGAGVDAAVFVKCCDTDNCNENQQYENLQIDTFPVTPLECPSCYEAGSTEECVSSSHVNCTTDQQECVNYVGQIQLADGSVQNMAFKGCITAGGCDIGFVLLPGTKELKCKKMECTLALPKVPKPTVIPHPV